jgi:malate dehydrogenase (oxaloacetate-decarboxylating)
LREQRFLLAGAGAAGVGIGRLLRTALLADGLDEPETRGRMLFRDSTGLVHTGRANLDAQKTEVAWPTEALRAAGMCEPLPVELEDIIKVFRPTVLIGTTGQAGEFTPEAIRTLAGCADRPLIFPLSNPTSKAECTPSEALQHSAGRAIIATGSPFEPVSFEGKRHVIGQCNNAFVFPGVGLGVLISEASRVSDSMFLAAARTVAEFTVSQPGWDGALYPSLRHLRSISRLIALKVAQTARDEGLGNSLSDEALQSALDDFIWYPDYLLAREDAEDQAVLK